MMSPDTIAPSARLIFAACSLGLMAIIVTMIRKHAIREKYALLWLPLGAALSAISIFPEILLGLSARIHLHYITVVLLGVIMVFIIILLYFTARLSQLREDVKQLAQESALSRSREAASAKRDAAPALPPAGKAPGAGAPELPGDPSWTPAAGKETPRSP